MGGGEKAAEGLAFHQEDGTGGEGLGGERPRHPDDNRRSGQRLQLAGLRCHLLGARPSGWGTKARRRVKKEGRREGESMKVSCVEIHLRSF